MKRAYVVLTFCVFALGAMLGCGGNNGDRLTGTLDPRILGTWMAMQIQYEGQTQACPGNINANNANLSCTSDTNTFTSDGHYTTGTITDDYYFDGTYLTMYNRAGNSATFLVSFDDTTNVMTWTYTLNGDPAVVTVDRQTE